MHQSVHDIFYDFNKKYEGFTDWMYLDIKGLVSIGVGNLIDPVHLALKEPFEYNQQPGSRATQADIAKAWQTVKDRQDLKLKGGFAYKGLTNIHLPEAAIRSLIEQRLFANELDLRTRFFPNFANWPADAQLGCLSMAWAMGSGFPGTFKKFRAACEHEDWDTARGECTIRESDNPGVVPRNVANRILFSNAAHVRRLGYQPEELYYPFTLFQDAVFTDPFDPVGDIDAALEGKEKYAGKAYFFKQNRYISYHWQNEQVELFYPQAIALWKKIPLDFQSNIDAAINGMGKYSQYAYFFKGDRYIRYNWKTEEVDFGSESLAAWKFPEPFSSGVDAAINGQAQFANNSYFFKGNQYLRYNWKENNGEGQVEFVQPISAWNFPTYFQSNIKAALSSVNSPSQVATSKGYFFKGDQYLRYDWKTQRVDAEYPKETKWHW